METRELKEGFYRHFKGKDKLYRVFGTAMNTETEEEMVIYMALYAPNLGKMYARPKKMFMEKVPDGRENPNNQTYRFEYLGLNL